MSDEVLIARDDQRPLVGMFGKLPATGDFVWRGLPDSFRKHWDSWLTRHIAPLLRSGPGLPADGLRFRLPSGGRLAAGLILPSRDLAGREFPLSLLLIADGDLPAAQIDAWCDRAIALRPETLSADEIWHELDAIPAPAPAGPATGPMQLWIAGRHPVGTDPEAPEAALRPLLDTA
jgi:type VI secretion system protein ImpM